MPRPIETQSLEDLSNLPGADLVIDGLKELEGDKPGECGLLVLVAATRLRNLGIDVLRRDDVSLPCEHQLYSLLEITHGQGAYSRYNSLIRRLVSFEQALANLRREKSKS